MEEVRRCLDALAEVIHTNVFVVVRDTLMRLAAMRAEIFPDEDPDYGFFESPLTRWLRETRAAKQVRDRDYGLSIAGMSAIIEDYKAERITLESFHRRCKFVTTRKWIELLGEFHRSVLRAVPESSAYCAWFRCGWLLGDWVNEHAIVGEQSALLGEKIQRFQRCAVELPQELYKFASWLKRLAKFKFREHSAAELSKLMNRPCEPNAGNPEHHNYQFQLNILYNDMHQAVFQFAFTSSIPKPGRFQRLREGPPRMPLRAWMWCKSRVRSYKPGQCGHRYGPRRKGGLT